MGPHERARDFLNGVIVASESPAVQYVLVSPDRVIWEFHSGLSDVRNRIRITGSHTLHAFSVTKTFTALSILQLQERGRLDIRDPVSRYVDDYPYEKEATIKQVLNHTAGLPNPLPLSWIRLADEEATFDYERFVGEVIRKNGRLRHRPGTAFSYSNLGYLLLGEVIRRVSGERYTDYIVNNVIARLGLDDQDSLGFTIPEAHPHCHGYIKTRSFLNVMLNFMFDKKKFMEASSGRWTPFRDFYVEGAAYGGLIGNARGFSRYLQALLSGDGLIGEAGKAELFAAQKDGHGRPIAMTLSWFPGRLLGRPYYTHPGGGGGYYCEIRLYPEDRLASVIMFNRTGVRKEDYLDRVDRYFLAR